MPDIIRDFIFASSHMLIGKSDGSVVLKFQARAPEFVEVEGKPDTRLLQDTVYKDISVAMNAKEARELAKELSKFTGK